MRAIQSLAVGKLAQRILCKEPKNKEIGNVLTHMGLVARKPVFGFPTKRDSNQPAQLQRLARKLKFRS